MSWPSAIPLLLTLSSIFCHPYGPPVSNQHHQAKQTSASSYQSSGNDQLRFNGEETQYYQSQPSNNAAPSYADLVNLQNQEAQQQVIINAQKKLETNKLVKDIEFIQKQQDMLQQQIRQQEIKNEQKLSGSYTPQNPGAYNAPQSNPGAYNSGQNNPGKFNNGQWVADGNANKFDDGLYKGEGGYGQAGSGTPGISYPEYQPDEVQRVPCSQPGYTCVAKHLCVNGKVNNNGIGIIQLRISQKSCRADIEVCCQEQDESAPSYPSPRPTGSYAPPQSGSYNQQPQTGSYNQEPQTGSYNQPQSGYDQPTNSSPETCNVCGGPASYTHQQSHHAEETSSYHHKESSSASLTQGGNLPRAKLPEFVPPSATATLPLLKQQPHSPAAGGYGK